MGIDVDSVVDIADDTQTTDEDTPDTVNVLANDTFEGSPTVTGVTQGTNGTVTNNNDGTVTYTPDADFNGTDSYEYTVTSGGVTETATVNVTVNPVVDIADDTATVAEDGSTTDNLLDNDSFEGSPSITAVTQGANGTVSIVDAAAGTVTYTPDPDFNGTDSYSYTVTSGGVTETATVNVTVNAVVDIADDTQTTDEDTANTVDVLANDSFEGTPSVTAVTQGTNGTVANNNNGTVTYTPDPDFNGTDSYTYTVTSGGVTETATVNVTVTAVDDGVADSFTTDEDTVLSADVSANDTFSAAATYSVNTDVSNGTLALNGDGTFDYTPDADFNGADSFTYDVEDVNGDTETVTVALTVNPVDDIADDTATVAEDGSTTDNLLANDSFEGSPLITAVTQGANGTVVNNNDGTVTYTPDDDFNGTDSYEYTVTSGGVIETATVNVTVNAVADGVADSFTTDEDTVLSDDVSTNDTFSAAANYSLNADASNGAVSLSPDGTFTYTPDADFNGSDGFTYDVEDVNGDTETVTVDLTVNPVVDIADDTATVAEDGSTTDNLLDNDSFEGSPSITAVTQGANGTVSIVDAAAGTVTYTPDPDFNGTDSYSYTVTSGGVTETATVNVTVNAVVDIADDTQTTDEDTANTVDVLANDSFEGTPSVTAVTQGTNGTVANNNNGTVTYTPDPDFNGTDSYTYTVTSGGVTETATVNVTVNAVADGVARQLHDR
ncbi:MAG: tandem-95 repeat protein [Gammaproteobacteria bacterium]|nr:tandem-95 repeat protein [Gammaproteobacteria bacterium]